MKKFRYIIILLLTFFSLSVFALDRATERKAFLAALSDLQHGNIQAFTVITTNLQNYPLYPYLIYAELVEHLPQATPGQVEIFLRDYANTPLADHLRYLWLTQLAEQKQWPLFLLNYTPTNDLTLQCLQRQALWETGQHQAAVNNLAQLFGNHQVLPKACINVFENALQSGAVATNLVWQRISLAFEESNLPFANQLATLLPASDQSAYILWRRFYQLAMRDPENAIATWQRITAQYPLDFDEKQRISSSIALGLAYQRNPSALVWLNSLVGDHVDDVIRTWRVRMALWQQNWPLVLAMIHQLTPAQQQDPAWRYWSARALAAVGQAPAASDIYHQLAVRPDFYGQLANLQLQQTPSFSVAAPKVDPMQVSLIANLPAMQRAYELYQLQWSAEANQEWNWQLRHLPQQSYLAAAELALQWGWYARAIDTLHMMTGDDNLSLRFPVIYRNEIADAAEAARLNPAWVFALIRQESSFMSNAHSGAGALGLMQLLPSTALLMADELHRRFSSSSLFDPGTNIQFGTIYLKKLSGLFGGNIVLATTSYNAGPARIEKWLPQQAMPADVWIETIPWEQPRDYVKNIMASMTFYERELGLPSTFNQRMQVIQKK